jgi:hypothetical protein
MIAIKQASGPCRLTIAALPTAASQGGFVIAFFGKTWLLWWMFAVVVILRWFHGLSAEPQTDNSDSSSTEHDRSSAVSGELASRA